VVDIETKGLPHCKDCKVPLYPGDWAAALTEEGRLTGELICSLCLAKMMNTEKGN
jgi:hypothetical protein